MSHTPGFLDQNCEINGLPLVVWGLGLGHGVRTPEREANARRLVACWNALDGISTEALEQSKPMAQLVIDHAMLIDALETVTTLLRGDGRFPATAAQLEITLAKHGRSA